MLLEREAMESAEDALRFHTEALARALTERAALDGPWGLLARLWRTHARDVAHCDARIAYHHQELRRAKERVAQLQRQRAPLPPSRPPRVEAHDDEAVAALLRNSEHPDAPRLRELERLLATLDAAHRQDALLHRTGSALVSAARGRSQTSSGRGLLGVVVRWMQRDDALEAARDAFSAACREATIPFESGTSLESQAVQAERILANLQERAIEHLRERRSLETERSRLLRRARDTLPSGGDDPG